MKHSKYIFSAMTIPFLVLFTGSHFTVSAQDVDEKIRIDTKLVLVDVLVRDKKGQIVKGLKAEQFEIFSDGVKQPVGEFAADEAAISFGVVYDMHPTTAESTKAVLGSLREFVKGLGTADDVFLVAFNMRGQQTFDFIPDMDQLERHMQKPEKNEPHSLYDAVYYASEHIQARRNQKKVLLIISDSADHRSKYSLSEVKKKLANIKTEAYAVVFDDWHDFRFVDIAHDRKRERVQSDASPLDRVAIADLASESGGETYFNGSENSVQLVNIYKQIVQEARSHYTLGFYPDVVDARRHDLRIRLKNAGNTEGWTLSYRMSYQMK